MYEFSNMSTILDWLVKIKIYIYSRLQWKFSSSDFLILLEISDNRGKH